MSDNDTIGDHGDVANDGVDIGDDAYDDGDEDDADDADDDDDDDVVVQGLNPKDLPKTLGETFAGET